MMGEIEKCGTGSEERMRRERERERQTDRQTDREEGKRKLLSDTKRRRKNSVIGGKEIECSSEKKVPVIK